MNLIRDRVEKWRKLTTYTPQDRVDEHRGTTCWSTTKAIDDQVQKEDLIRDAQKPQVPFKPLPEVVVNTEHDALALYRFVHGILSL